MSAPKTGHRRPFSPTMNSGLCQASARRVHVITRSGWPALSVAYPLSHGEYALPKRTASLSLTGPSSGHRLRSKYRKSGGG